MNATFHRIQGDLIRLDRVEWVSDDEVDETITVLFIGGNSDSARYYEFDTTEEYRAAKASLTNVLLTQIHGQPI